MKTILLPDSFHQSEPKGGHDLKGTDVNIGGAKSSKDAHCCCDHARRDAILQEIHVRKVEVAQLVSLSSTAKIVRLGDGIK